MPSRSIPFSHLSSTHCPYHEAKPNNQHQPQHTPLPTLTPQHQPRRRIARRRLLHQDLSTRSLSCSRQSSALRNQCRAISLVLNRILTDESTDCRCGRDDLMRCRRGVVGNGCGGGGRRPIRCCASVGDIGCAGRGGRCAVRADGDGGVCCFDDDLRLKVAGGCWYGGPLWCRCCGGSSW